MARQRVDTEPICGLPASKENPQTPFAFRVGVSSMREIDARAALVAA